MRHVIETPVGRLAASWTSKGLYACEFLPSRHGSVPEEALTETVEAIMVDGPTRQLEKCLLEYFETGCLTWDLEMLDWTGVTAFQRRVLKLCYAIPSGRTLSYGELAQRAGSPLAARAVGSTMARNRWPIIIPCHRVIGATGRLTGYSGNGGVATKQHLLELESQALLVPTF